VKQRGWTEQQEVEIRQLFERFQHSSGRLCDDFVNNSAHFLLRIIGEFYVVIFCNYFNSFMSLSP